jgi:hypothetical protein
MRQLAPDNLNSICDQSASISDELFEEIGQFEGQGRVKWPKESQPAAISKPQSRSSEFMVAGNDIGSIRTNH